MMNDPILDKFIREIEDETNSRIAGIVRYFVTATIRPIQEALGTEETGDALVKIAADAHRAEQEFATLRKFLNALDDAD